MRSLYRSGDPALRGAGNGQLRDAHTYIDIVLIAFQRRIISAKVESPWIRQPFSPSFLA